MQTIQQSRSLAPDLARGFMLLLIAMAYTDAHLSDWGTQAPETQNDSILEQTAISIKTLLRDNRAYPMFAFLFGYGSVLLFQKLERSNLNSKLILKRFRMRAFWLLVFGFFHSVLVFSYEILAPYGIALLITAPLLFKTDYRLQKTLKILVPIFIILLIGVGFMYAVPPEMYDSESYGMPVNSYGEMVISGLKNFPMSALMVLGYPIIPVMITGMLAARLKLLDNKAAPFVLLKKISRIGISISIIGAVPLLLKELHFWQPIYQMEALAHALHLISGAFGGVSYAALFGIIAYKLQHSTGKMTQAVAALGKRSLTGYLLQSTVIMLLMSSFFGNLGMQLSYFQSAVLGFVVWLGVVTFAYVLESRNVPGPFDSLLRKLANRPENN